MMRRSMLTAVSLPPVPGAWGVDPVTEMDQSIALGLVANLPGSGSPLIDIPAGGATITSVKMWTSGGTTGGLKYFAYTSAGVITAITELLSYTNGTVTISGFTLAVPAGGGVGVWFNGVTRTIGMASGSADAYEKSSITGEPSIGSNISTGTFLDSGWSVCLQLIGTTP